MSERARQVAGTALAAALNRVVVGSPRHADDIVLLEGRSVVLTLEPLQRAVALTVADGRIAVLPDTGVAPDVSISGRGRDFLAMARAGQNGSSLAAGRLSISGDVGSAQAWQRLFSGLDDDLELLVAEAIGADAAGR
ncbi:MAG: SCP2 sterol-binding domain-containing protein, partial [Gammaproteobacteria bacterium]|nr:SCP2 sterol-binding domain-containing protein [Gammaproteobacteria bacterium]